MNIMITFTDGSYRVFKHEGRPGGSYTKEIEYKKGFVIITDEWGHQTIYPESRISKIETKPHRGSF